MHVLKKVRDDVKTQEESQVSPKRTLQNPKKKNRMGDLESHARIEPRTQCHARRVLFLGEAPASGVAANYC